MGVFLLWLVILCVIIGSNLSREKKKNQDRNLNRPQQQRMPQQPQMARQQQRMPQQPQMAQQQQRMPQQPHMGTATAKYATAENAGMAEKLWCIQTRH